MSFQYINNKNEVHVLLLADSYHHCCSYRTASLVSRLWYLCWHKGVSVNTVCTCNQLLMFNLWALLSVLIKKPCFTSVHLKQCNSSFTSSSLSSRNANSNICFQKYLILLLNWTCSICTNLNQHILYVQKLLFITPS